MNIVINTIGVWDPTSIDQRFPVPISRITSPPKIEETENCVKFLKTKLLNYLKKSSYNKETLTIELPSVSSGGKEG